MSRIRIKHQCLYCKKYYNHEKASSKYCSVPCVRKQQKILNKIRRKERREKMAGIKINKKGFYISKKEDYKSSIIDYPSSPTGKAYIGIAKRPLMPNENGIGYQGVLIQDDARQFVQCSGCGKWCKHITATHLNKCSGISQEEFREKFGLYSSEGLVSDETSLHYTQNALKNLEGLEAFKKNINKNAIKGAKANTKSGNTIKSFKSRQWQNAHGTCPEQLKARLKEFIIINKELPGQHNRGYSLYKSLIRQFGNASKGFKHYGLPYRERNGTNLKFTFSDNTVYGYNLNKPYDRNALYEMMLSKCELLNQ